MYEKFNLQQRPYNIIKSLSWTANTLNKYQRLKSIIPFSLIHIYKKWTPRPFQSVVTKCVTKRIPLSKRHATPARESCHGQNVSQHLSSFSLNPLVTRSPFMILWLHHILVVISNAPSVSSSTSSMSPPGFDVVPFSLAVSLSTWNKNMDIIYLLVTTSVLWHKFFPTTFVTSKEQRKTLIFKLIKMTNFELDRRISHWLAYWSTSFLCWNHFISKMIGGER